MKNKMRCKQAIFIEHNIFCLFFVGDFVMNFGSLYRLCISESVNLYLECLEDIKKECQLLKQFI